ncbi:MAG: hypothetical protein IJ950_08480, partial [Helicobacter sp.]|nr:hypothetical protein [Helicobacter sp.]
AEKFGEWLTDWAEDFAFEPLENKLKLTDFFPREISEEMQFHLSLYKGTGNEKYFDRFLELCDFAIYDFWDLKSLLPSMTHAQKKYYESTWGSGEIVYYLWSAHFMELEKTTGNNPLKEAHEKSGSTPKTMKELWEEENFKNFMERNKSATSLLEIGENAK